jgi:hypothetical protein
MDYTIVGGAVKLAPLWSTVTREKEATGEPPLRSR